MPEQRQDHARRPHEVPQHQPNDRKEPERDAPADLPEPEPGQTPLAEAEIDADDAQLLDPAAEPGKPV